MRAQEERLAYGEVGEGWGTEDTGQWKKHTSTHNPLCIYKKFLHVKRVDGKVEMSLNDLFGPVLPVKLIVSSKLAAAARTTLTNLTFVSFHGWKETFKWYLLDLFLGLYIYLSIKEAGRHVHQMQGLR